MLGLSFLEGRMQSEVARHLGKNQATVSRGILAMREALRSRGVITGAGLAALFTAQSAQAMPVAVQVSLGKLSFTGIGTSSAIPAASFTTTLITMTVTTKALLVTGTLAAVSLPFVLPRTEHKPATSRPSAETKAITTNPISKSNPAEISDQEMFDLFFGSDLDRSKQARSLVDDYRAVHPGLSLIELAKEPALAPKLQALMQDMMTRLEVGKQFSEAMQLAMQVKGIKPSPGTNISLNMGEEFLNNESQAERYLGAVLANDAKALAQLFADVVNEAAAEMALDPGADKSSSGVSISKGPLPLGTKVIQKKLED